MCGYKGGSVWVVFDWEVREGSAGRGEDIGVDMMVSECESMG